MKPTGIFALLLTALLIDWLSFGPDSVRDRLAFCLALPAIRAGWDGSALDRWTVDTLSTWIDQVKNSGNVTLAHAVTGDVIRVLVCLLGVYCVGVLLPARWSSKLGRFATLAFRGAGGPGGGAVGKGGGGLRLNVRLWACAWLLGMLVDLARGAVGELLLGGVNALSAVVTPLPATLFGVSS